MKANHNYGISQDEIILIEQVMVANNFSPSSIMKIWGREMTLKEIKGVLSIAQMESGDYFAIVNMPVLIMPVNGKTLSFLEIMQLLTCIGDVPTARYALQDCILYFSLCFPLDTFREEQIPEAMGGLLEGVKSIRRDLLRTINHFYPGEEIAESKSEGDEPIPQLPDIKMTPSDAQVIYGILARCSQQVQVIYILLMEKWEKAGFFVETTPSSIVLDIPYGPRRTRLAMLLPGISKSVARLIPGLKPQPPMMILMWDNLRKQKGFPSEALDTYQKTVKKIASLHFTESSAHLDLDKVFPLTMARKLLKAMTDLAKSAQADQVEPPTTSKPVTPENLARSLELCDQNTQKVFQVLMDGWKKAGGTIQCKAVGRIYLRMKTKPHKTGNAARIPRNFNLVVLASPKGKNRANIQVSWNLAADNPYAYLDCISEKVAYFEGVISSLPGFEQKGTITRLVLDEKFQGTHAKLLARAILALKEAEANTA